MARVTEAHVEARRNQIVDAAWACFARRGYHQTTMQDIASEAGISAGAIYHYYPSKEGVLKALNDRSQEMGRALVAEARSLAEGPLDALEVIGQTMFGLFDDPMFETTTRVNIEIWPEIIRNDVLRANLRQEGEFWLAAVAQLLREAKSRGQLKADVNPEALAVLFICAFEGLRHFKLVDPDNFTPQRLLDALRAFVPDVRVESGLSTQSLATPGPPFATHLSQPRRRSRGKEDSRRSATNSRQGEK